MRVFSQLLYAYTFYFMIRRFSGESKLRETRTTFLVIGASIVLGLTPYAYAASLLFSVFIAVKTFKEIRNEIKYFILLILINIVSLIFLYQGLGGNLDALSNVVTVVRIALCMLLLLVTIDYQSRIIEGTYVKAITDSLTGLLNNKKIKQVIRSTIDAQVDFSIMFLDLDDFKSINKAVGHAAGDEVLKSVAKIVKEEFDGIGFVGRYGGEEVVAILTDSYSGSLLKKAEDIRIRVENEVIYQSDQSVHAVTASIGVCDWTEEWSAEECLKNANEAMYKAKSLGKNRVVHYNEIWVEQY
ncbi:GGDEF domain-containing protein [Paenibacillus sp. 1A_MP2]|uniref:GGDEF domain-containing protein n=1 Tax=Paenibacillus sp. 1A_MP2 TaxID=3457495 RepID=UPI003FCDC604